MKVFGNYSRRELKEKGYKHVGRQFAYGCLPNQINETDLKKIVDKSQQGLEFDSFVVYSREYPITVQPLKKIE